MKFISLFAGIGGLDLGLERAGFECVAQVEINEFALRVLQKHWANIPKFKDVRDVGKHNLPNADLLCGGFPCQDVSLAGQRAGLEGKRSTLWSEFHRIVCEIRPRWVVIENVPGLLSSDNGEFFTKIFRELSQSGYDAEWRIISASDLGAPHIRERLFIVAYPNGYIGLDGVLQTGRDTFSEWRKKSVWGFDWSKSKMESRPATILQRWQRLAVRQSPLIRMDDGIPDVVERLHATGNAVVPAVAEFIGHSVMKAQARLTPRALDGGTSAEI